MSILNYERRYKMTKRRMGIIYVDGDLFGETSAKTMGEAIIGQDALLVFANRYNVKGRLSPQGTKHFAALVKKLEKALPDGMKIEIKFDRHAGCSMCACSPGFVIYEVGDFFKSQKLGRDYQFTIDVGPKGEVTVENARSGSYYKEVAVKLAKLVKKQLNE